MVVEAMLLKRSADKSQNRYFKLYELFQSISSTLDPEKALNLIIDAAVKITGASSGSLCLVDWDKNILDIKVSRGFIKPIGDLKLQVGEGITGWVAKHDAPLLVRDISKDHRYVELKEDIKSELAVPLEVDGELIGVVNVDSVKVNAFDVEDLELLTLLSKQSAQVIRNSRLYDTVHRKVEELSTLIEVNKTIAGTLSLDRILHEIVERTAKLMDSKLCALRLLSDDGAELVLRAHYGRSSIYSDAPDIRVKGSLIGKVIQTGEAIQVQDVKKQADYRLFDFAQQEGLCALLSVPLKVRETIIGVININKATSYVFSQEEVTLLHTFADLCAIAIENARLYNKMVILEEQTRRAERLAAVGELAAGVAHEIRNPLTIIKMIFESGGELNSKDVEVITEELERMNQIVTHFLKFAKPKEPNREACDVNKNLENVLLLLSHSVDSKRIQLSKHLEENLPIIQADTIQLQQVLFNLLMNSIEALPEEGKVEITSRSLQPDSIAIDIRDNGSGIPKSVKDNLYVPFTTTKPKGLGLGLSIVKRIVRVHKGKVEIESEEGQGTLVHIELPIE
jgi:signal transduction histidine kinase